MLSETLSKTKPGKSANLILMLGLVWTLATLSACDSPDQGGSSATSVDAQLAQAGLQQDIHYSVIKKSLPMPANQITVSEFFWYGCSHCEAFEPTLHQWEKNLPAAIVVEQVPAIWSKPMELHAKAFYLARSMDQYDALHAALFKKIIALRSEKNMTTQKEQLAELFAAHGMSAETFMKEIDARELEAKMRDAKALMAGAGIQSTPTLMVDGRYLVLNKMAESPTDITDIADKLIDVLQSNSG